MRDLKAVALDRLNVDVFGTERVADVDEQVHSSFAVIVLAEHRLTKLLSLAARRRHVHTVGPRAAERLLGTTHCPRPGVRFHQQHAVRAQDRSNCRQVDTSSCLLYTSDAADDYSV